MNELNIFLNKHISPPPVIFTPNLTYGGMYCSPRNEIQTFNGKEYTTEKGLIIINTDYPDLIPNALAHEYRHHYQMVNGTNQQSYYNPSQDIPYENRIINYFTSYQNEMDALLFAHKECPDWCSYYWLDLLKIGTNKHYSY